MDITQNGRVSEQSDGPADPTPSLPQSTSGKQRKPLRLWPGLIAAALLILARFIVPYIAPPAAGYALATSFIAVLLIAIWWLLFSRAPWIERIGAIVLMAVTIIATKRVVHPSIAGGGMGFLIYVLAVPVFALALVCWAYITRNLTNSIRRITLAGTILLVCVGFLFLRTGGITADFDNDFHFRWSKTPEEQLLTEAEEAVAAPISTAAATGTEWPGFRGRERDGVVHGTKIKTDWATSPPVEMWRRPIGPGWSSFAVSGDRFYTQEQRGNDEIVACYEVKTGKPIWRHRDNARFWESNGGPGPRGTPTLHNGRVYSLGATGILNALDANNGNVMWSKNAGSDSGTKVPVWGYSASPIVVDDKVVVAASGALVAYDAASGERRWVMPANGVSYSSPHLAKIGGTPQIIMLNYEGAIGVSPANGQKLWSFSQPPNARIIQPALTGEGDVLTHDGESTGMRRLAVSQGPNGWSAQEKWFSEGLNPYFSDFVVHKGYAYGFDGSGIACIDLKDGNRKWKGGQYGHGQLVLLADQDVLVVVTEDGQLALLKATPDQFAELGKIRAITGKTWNHPVVTGDVVLVRNGEEMAAFRLPSA